MLPSFRLIAATFLCGFVVVFAGLRMAVSLHDIHGGLPVMAAHAAPVSVTPATDGDARRGLAAVPVMYDLRFAVSTVSPTLVAIAPTVTDLPAPALSMPLSIVPSQDLAKQESAEPAKETPEPESAVAAIQPDAPVSATSDAPAGLDAPAEPSKPDTQAVAAVDPQGKPDLEASTAEALIPEPDTTASVGASDPARTAVPTPAAKPQTAKPAPKTVAIAKVVRKKRVLAAQHAAPANNPPGIDPASNPFGAQ